MRRIFSVVGAAILIGGVAAPVHAEDVTNVVNSGVDAFAGVPALGADHLVDLRGGMARPKVKEIVVVGVGGGEPIESVVPELGNIVVLAATAGGRQLGRLILDSDPATAIASGISEPLITTAAGISRGLATGFGDGIRGRIPSGGSSTPQINPPSLQLDTGLVGALDGLGRVKVRF